MRFHQGILVSCQIPFDEKERLLEGLFREAVQAALDRGFRNVYVFGTAGEGHAVDNAQFRDIVQIFYEETLGKEVTPQVGLIDMSTRRVVQKLQVAYETGFRIFQISFPGWGVLNDTEMMTFFGDVCGASPDSSFLHYNLPRAWRILKAPEYRRIADEVPNLVATKNTILNIRETVELMRLVPEVQHFLGEAHFGIACLYGECSLLSSWGLLFPSRTKELFEYGRKRQFPELFALAKEYMEVSGDLFRTAQRGEAHMDGAYDKLWTRLGGIEMPLRLLSPYQSFSEEIFEACLHLLREKYPEWLEE
jgi:dihydrodipicolinate synthase/N-acetylneuraminate lyase